jgi:hypothetical protein
MIRRSVAGLILGLSLLAGSFAWSGYIALQTVLEPDRSREVAEELLDNETVRGQLIDSIADALFLAIPAEVPVDDATVRQVSETVLNSPELEALLLNAFADSHSAFLGEGTAPESLDLSAASAAARDALVQSTPALDTALPAAPALAIPLPTEYIPDASPLRSFLQLVVPILAIGALAGAVMALVTTTDRPAILRRAGTWALTTTAVYLLVGLGLPWLLRRVAPDGAEVFAAFFTAILRATRTPSIILGLSGLGLLAASGAWHATGSRQPKQKAPRRAQDINDNRDAPHRRSAQRDPRSREPVEVYRPPEPSPQGYRPPPQAPRPGVGQLNPTTVFADVPPPRAEPPRPVPQSPYPDATRGPASPYPDAAPTASPYPDAAPGSPNPDAPQPASSDKAFTPRWQQGHGWVLHPDDPRPPPRNARWVEGVGYVVPGPPP